VLGTASHELSDRAPSGTELALRPRHARARSFPAVQGSVWPSAQRARRGARVPAGVPVSQRRAAV